MATDRALTWVVNTGDHNHDDRYYRKDQLGDTATNGTAGAKLIGTFDQFDNSDSLNVQDVLNDFDAKISLAVAGGEVNTGLNAGTSGVGVFYQKSGPQLQFKNINTNDSHITITDDSGNHEIDISSDATNLNTASTLVARDASGNFSAGTITADLVGNSSSATILETARTIGLTGDASGSISFDGSANVNINTTVDKVDGKDVDDGQTSTSYLWTAGKIITYVEGVLNGLDWQESVKDKDLSTPPGSPSSGDRYIIKASGTGAWSGHDNDITEWNGTAWTFVTPTEGGAAWVEDEDKNYTFNGTSWVTFGSTQTHNNLSGLQGGTTNEYYHLTNSQHTNLTDGGDTTLHIHDSRYFTETESNTHFLRRDASSSPTTNNTLDLGDVNHVWANMYATNFNGTATYAKYADLAEKYTVKGDYKIGDVILVSTDENYDCEVCNEIGSSKTIGVVSENPAFAMNDELEDGIYVALKGRIPCKVQGPVQKGDSLISGNSGTAVSIANGRYDIILRIDTKIIGIANESIASDDIKLIEVIL